MEQQVSLTATLKERQLIESCKLSEHALSHDEFLRVDLRVGRIVSVSEFPEARKPAYKLRVDFGSEIGTKWTSAQITKRYTKEALKDKKVVAVVNFPPKRIADFVSEVLVLGVDDGNGGVILLEPESDEAPLGARVY